MLTRSILITGCNRGLGLELVRQLVRHPNAPECIFAACRNPDHAEVCHLFSISGNPFLRSLFPSLFQFYGNIGLNLFLLNVIKPP